MDVSNIAKNKSKIIKAGRDGVNIDLNNNEHRDLLWYGLVLCLMLFIVFLGYQTKSHLQYNESILHELIKLHEKEHAANSISFIKVLFSI